MFITHLSPRAIFTESELPDKMGFVHVITTAYEGVMMTNIDIYLYSAKFGHCTQEVIRHPHSHWPLIAFRLHHEHLKATRQELFRVEKLPYWFHVAQGMFDQIATACRMGLSSERRPL